MGFCDRYAAHVEGSCFDEPQLGLVAYPGVEPPLAGIAQLNRPVDRLSAFPAVIFDCSGELAPGVLGVPR